MKTIFLIGFMGSGKSTIGKVLSETYDLSFVDIDDFIEQKYEQKITDIFKMYGEEVFRNYEHEALQEVTTYNVVATGGGVVERENNINVMKNAGTIVYLQASFAEIDERLKHNTTRPLWQNSDFDTKVSLYKRRNRLYTQCADYKIQTDHKTIENIVSDIGDIFSLTRT